MSLTPATLLLEQFDHLLTTPEAVEELNRAILTLAVQGKLVARDANGLSTNDFYKNVIAERATQAEVSSIPNAGKFTTRDEARFTFSYPKEWLPISLHEACTLITDGKHGDCTDQPESGYFFLSAKDITAGKLNYNNARQIQYEDFLEVHNRTRFEPGDVVVTCSGTIGKTAVAVEDPRTRNTTFQKSVAILKPVRSVLNPQFLEIILAANLRLLTQTAQGSATQNLLLRDLKAFGIGLPPLAEQQRIVARVEALFAQTRQLAEKLNRAQSDLALLNQSALAYLLAAETPEEFAKQWDFIAQHFDSLFTEPEYIAPLRQAILELAVRGKLTHREATDEPASALLARIQAEKAKTGKVESLPPVRASEQPFELPGGWEWVRLGHLVPEFQNGIGRRESASSGKELIVLRLADVGSGSIDLGNARSIVLLEEEIKKYDLKPNDILITRVNGSIDLIGSFTLINQGDFYSYCDHFIRMRLLPNTVDATYLAKIAKSEFIRSQIRAKFITTAGQKTVNQRHISSLLFPLPPLAEQKRIVVKVEQLLGLCDVLEAKLRSAREERIRLTAAVLAGVGNGSGGKVGELDGVAVSG